MLSTMPAPTPFLRLVAQAFVDNYADSLHDICFIFPNRRSGVFFLKELASIVQKPTLSPEVITISDFLCDVTGSVEALQVLLVLGQFGDPLIGRLWTVDLTDMSSMTVEL